MLFGGKPFRPISHMIFCYLFYSVVILCTEDKEDKLKILQRALDQGMMAGNFVFFLQDQILADDILTPNGVLDKAAFSQVFQVTFNYEWN